MEDQATPTQTPPVINEPAAPTTLAQAIRVKFPGKYNNLTDTELEQNVISVHPEYATWPRTHVSSQEAIAAMHKVNAANGDIENVKGGIAGAFTPQKPTGTEVSDAVKAGIGEVGHGLAGLPSAIRHPINTIMGVADEMRPHVQGAIEAVKKGQPIRAFGEAASSFPVVGPQANAIGEEMGRTGNLPRAVGRGAALIGMTAGPQIAEAAGIPVRAAGATKIGQSLADTLAKKGGEMTAEAITPVRGPGAGKFAGKANDIGEAVATHPDLKGMTPPGLQQSGRNVMDRVVTEMDAAQDARLPNKPHDVDPIIAALEAKKAEVTQMQPFEGSSIASKAHQEAGQVGQAVPIGKTVQLPSPEATARAAQIQKTIDALRGLGKQTSYDNLKKLRIDNDQVAKPLYATQPAQTLEAASTNSGTMKGAADSAHTIREVLADSDPVTARLNPQYSMLRKLDDVLEAVKIGEQTRPVWGRRMIEAVVGAGSGHFANAVLYPLADVAIRSGPNAQLVAGRTFGQIAQMLRTGDAAGLTRIMAKLQKAGFTGEAGQQARPETAPIKEPQ